MADDFPLPMNREWEAPEFHLEFMWVNKSLLFKELHVTFRMNKELEMVAVGDTLYSEDAFRVLEMVFREVKPKLGRRAFSLKKEWELTEEGDQTLDTIKSKNSCGICGQLAEVGPFAGGPFSWYCKRCNTTIRTFLKASKEHKEWFEKMRQDASIEVSMKNEME